MNWLEELWEFVKSFPEREAAKVDCPCKGTCQCHVLVQYGGTDCPASCPTRHKFDGCHDCNCPTREMEQVEKMTELDCLQIVYNYRLEPDPLAVPMILSFTAKNRLLFSHHTAIAWSGIIGALCERHSTHYAMWKGMHGETINQSIKVEKHIASQTRKQWAEHLLFRWMILETDECAWKLLLRAHDANQENAQAAQRCIEKVCMGTEIVDRRGLAITDSQGTTLGNIAFPDLRQQIIELTEEFRAMTVAQRRLPFSLLPFSKEFCAERHARRLDLAAATSSFPSNSIH